uniref:Phosphoglycolate phosphatase n=1 Tax=Candidatus Kentrum sp. TC TaxID=2126339 RepID=A0A450Z558_9GAMM|nr:MAG: phosphoglycolate phosphatase [Candidatus Kentron sp. TC]VFK52215.1 MAG: phosphoglycolate phosphatase [Candidatus Kentron sp. TC]VFK64823.1 MAG: phosphoglycolate phosphatase [Candidatus Kentron sp. TC]
MGKVVTCRSRTRKFLRRFDAILFDLDGTLADTAPDLLFALNQVITEEGGTSLLSLSEILPFVSRGGRAMVQRAFGFGTEAPHFPALFDRFLDVYHDNIALHTVLFSGMEEVLLRIEAYAMQWGIVTNKSERLTRPLIEALGLSRRVACVIAGDTTVHRKPYPDSLLFACRQLGTIPVRCLYIGDAAKDIEAGLRAGTYTAVALFGYISLDDEPKMWGADFLFSSPRDIFDWLANSSHDC